MKVPFSWLLDYVDLEPKITAKDVGDALTLTGIQCEGVWRLGASLSGIVVGKIIGITKHPNADKLFITQTDVGTETLQIITGADNLKEGDYIPVALHGAHLNDGTLIKRGRLRGEQSDGMLCSIEELGGRRADFPEAPEYGIYVFEKAQTLGADVCEILELKDYILDFDVLSNRPDCQSIIGIAREVAAAFNVVFKQPKPFDLDNPEDLRAEDYVSVKIREPLACPRYVAAVINDARINPSPQWLRRRLSKCGVTPLNNMVDITNYVLHEYGHPLHAFDIENCQEGRIIVRNSKENETITTLDGRKRTLPEGTLLITDPIKPLAIAGIMGGESSKITEETRTILLESANFESMGIRISSKRLGLRTDASGKYEKGVDPALASVAAIRALELIKLLNAGNPVPWVLDVYPGQVYPRSVAYNYKRINALLGADFKKEEIIKFLERANIQSDGETAIIPSCRLDITCEADIAEEAARLYGYDKLNSNTAQRNIIPRKEPVYFPEEKAKRVLASLGYLEALTSPFEGEKERQILKEITTPVEILNPMGEEFKYLRTSPLNGILTALGLNFARKRENARLFELTKVFEANQKGELPKEKVFAVIAFYDKNENFFNLKGDCEEFIKAMLGQETDFITDSANPLLHPGRSGLFINKNGETIGYAGEAHPDICEVYELPRRVYISVLDFSFFKDKPIISPYKMTIFPSAQRDIAVVAKRETQARDLLKTAKQAAGVLCKQINIFDVYEGSQLPDGMKSIAMRLELAADDRTLTELDIKNVMKSVNSALEAIGAKIRDF